MVGFNFVCSTTSPELRNRERGDEELTD